MPPQNAWLRTVRLFAEVSALDSPKQEKEALKELKAAAAEDRSGRYPEGLAKRIALHFASPSKYKSFSDLMDLYQDAEDNDQRLAVLWALHGAAHPETPGFFRGLLFASEPDWLLQPLVTWFRAHPEELPRIPEVARAYLGKPSGERGLMLHLMLEAAEASDGPVLWTLLPSSGRVEIEILRGTTPWQAVILARWFAQHPSPEAIPWLRRLPLYTIRGESWIMEALAASGDPEILGLALEEDLGMSPWAASIVAWSPLPAAVEEARRILAEVGPALSTVVSSLGDEGNSTPWREWFLDEVVRSEHVPEGYRDWARHFLQRSASSEWPEP